MRWWVARTRSAWVPRGSTPASRKTRSATGKSCGTLACRRSDRHRSLPRMKDAGGGTRVQDFFLVTHHPSLGLILKPLAGLVAGLFNRLTGLVHAFLNPVHRLVRDLPDRLAGLVESAFHLVRARALVRRLVRRACRQCHDQAQ